MTTEPFWDDLWDRFGDNPTEKNCITISRNDFDAAVGALSPNAKHQIDRGCVGLCRLCQTCGGGDDNFPDKAERTVCVPWSRKDEISKFKCRKGTPFVFVVEGPTPLPDKFPLEGETPFPPNSDRYNYIAQIGNYCVGMNHGINKPADRNDQHIKICKGKDGNPPRCESSDYPNRMICRTCREPCDEQK